MGTSGDSLVSRSCWLALGVAIATTAGASIRLYETSLGGACNDWQIAVASPGMRCLSQEYAMVTDKGNRLPLYTWSAASHEFRLFAITSEQQYLQNFPSIRREPASDQTNCHGWVFTQGRHLLFGAEVEQILRDNDYWVADRPNTNDIIVYRNSHGTIIHSGIVRAVFTDGTVMIESKWGISARYLHLPTDQPYGDTYHYYRGDSTTHDVCVMPLEGEGSMASTGP